MTAAAPVQTPAKAAAPGGGVGGARALLGRQLHVATRLFEAGRKVVGTLWREATAKLPRPFDADAFCAVWPKVWRALRMALLLRERLLAELQAPSGAGFKATAAGRDEGENELDDFQRELDEMQRELDREFRADLYEYESFDRLPVDRLKRYVMTRPVEELFEEIRQGLGLAPDWLGQVEEEWQRLQAAEAPSSPAGKTAEAPRGDARGAGPCAGSPPPTLRAASAAGGGGRTPDSG